MKILSSIGKTTIVVAALLSAICSSNSKEYPTGFWLILLDNKNQYETGKLAGMARGMMWAQAASKQKIFCPPEELGITDFTPELLTNYVFESTREKELVFSHKTVYDGPITPSEELAGGRFWTLDEIRANMGKDIFTPNFENEFRKLGF